MRVILVLLVIAPIATAAQEPAAPQLPEPRLIDSPWGDFPLERLQAGARLRLTAPGGRRSEARLVTLRDSAVELRIPNGVPVTSMALTDLRALRAFEVRALPLPNRRREIRGLIAGVALGAMIGAVTYKDAPAGTADRDRPTRADRIGSAAGVGSLVGWYVGGRVLGRARWRPVTLP
jgi:hypothetical protein